MTVTVEESMAERGALMAAEMAEQPERLAGLLARRQEIRSLAAEARPGDWRGTILVARGSSDCAATTGRHLMETSSRRPVSMAAPTVTTRYGTTMYCEGYLVIALSQSGRTPEITEVLTRGQAGGARTIAIVNDATSPLAGAADVVVDVRAGPERAIPATKTVTAELLALVLVAEGLSADSAAGAVTSRAEAELDRLPSQVATLIGDTEGPERIARRLTAADHLVTVARGPLLGAAYEAALKIEETSGVLTKGFSSADLLHGPIAAITRDTPVLAFAGPGPTWPDLINLRAALTRRLVSPLLVGPRHDPRWLPDVEWSALVPERLAAIPAVVRAQQIAWQLACHRGVDPDAPPGLTKVTPT